MTGGGRSPAPSADSGRRAPRVLALFGPTGVGKTAVAVEVALRLGVRVISCDSMQIYRGFPVLTNQPDALELERVRHEFVAVADPHEEWNAADYGRAAQALIDEDVAAGGPTPIVRGTGLYLRAALAPLAMPDARDPRSVDILQRRAETEGAEALHRELAAADPEAARSIPPENVRRTIRALEVVSVLGPGSWSGRNDLWAPQYRHPTLLVALTARRDEIYRRVNERARVMLARGAVEEVRSHRAEDGAANAAAGAPPAEAPRGVRRAIGYREIAAYLDGDRSLEDTTRLLAAATRRYVRRQTTWMRKLEGAVIIDASHRDASSVADEILETAGLDPGEHQ